MDVAGWRFGWAIQRPDGPVDLFRRRGVSADDGGRLSVASADGLAATWRAGGGERSLLPAAVLLICGGLTWMLRWQATPLELGFADFPAGKMAVVASAVVAAFFLPPPGGYFGAGSRGLVGRELMVIRRGRTRAACGAKFLRRAARVRRSPVELRTSFGTARQRHGNQSLDPQRAARAVDLLSSHGTAGSDIPGVAAPPTVGRNRRAGVGHGHHCRVRPTRRADHVLRDRSGRGTYRPEPAVLHLPGRLPREGRGHLGRCTAFAGSRAAPAFDLLVLDVFSSDSVPHPSDHARGPAGSTSNG